MVEATHEQTDHPRLRLRVYLEDKVWIGPGKADLLELIRETGSISEAGRRMKMSYKRAWTLVETLNTTFHEPLVQSERGGAGGGGAMLTPAGAEVLALYRDLQRRAAEAGGPQMQRLQQMRALKPGNGPGK